MPCARSSTMPTLSLIHISPVVDMEKLILALMQQAGVTEEQLRAAGEIPTDFGETLSWPYLCWVCLLYTSRKVYFNI